MPPTAAECDYVIRRRHGTVHYDGSLSKSFPIHSGVKQGCVLAPTLFGKLFFLLLSYAFGLSSEGVRLHSRTDDKLFNPARLRAVTKGPDHGDALPDDAALISHSGESLQKLIDQLAQNLA